MLLPLAKLVLVLGCVGVSWAQSGIYSYLPPDTEFDLSASQPGSDLAHLPTTRRPAPTPRPPAPTPRPPGPTPRPPAPTTRPPAPTTRPPTRPPADEPPLTFPLPPPSFPVPPVTTERTTTTRPPTRRPTVTPVCGPPMICPPIKPPPGPPRQPSPRPTTRPTTPSVTRPPVRVTTMPPHDHHDPHDHHHHHHSSDPLEWLRESVPGEPGVDYPILGWPIVDTVFSCAGRPDGYYADPETRCQAFHICLFDQDTKMLCPNGTIFNQEYFTCSWWKMVDCSTAQSFYELNNEIGVVPVDSPYQVRSPRGTASFTAPSVPLSPFSFMLFPSRLAKQIQSFQLR